jgi:hypothetical protein
MEDPHYGTCNSGVSAVTLQFPNPSRSFDEMRKAIRFIGHDNMFEVPFFVEVSRSPGLSRIARHGAVEGDASFRFGAQVD